MKTIIAFAAAAAGAALRGVLLVDCVGGRGASTAGIARPWAVWRTAEGTTLKRTSIQQGSVGAVPV